MLFLAVFCGFLAEYQLEHKIEKERGMEYIRSFYEDLKSDTAEYSGLIADYETKVAVLGKRNECFDSLPRQIRSFNPCLVDLFNYASGFPDLINADRTLLQLKNAGGLRLLKKADADSILLYDKMVRNYIKSETTGFQDAQYKIREVMNSLMNYKNIKLKQNDPSVPFLYSNNPDQINKFFVLLKFYSATCYNLSLMLKDLRQKATDLIIYFNNKYHLK
jgi:hypothetical protein